MKKDLHWIDASGSSPVSNATAGFFFQFIVIFMIFFLLLQKFHQVALYFTIALFSAGPLNEFANPLIFPRLKSHWLEINNKVANGRRREFQNPYFHFFGELKSSSGPLLLRSPYHFPPTPPPPFKCPPFPTKVKFFSLSLFFLEKSINESEPFLVVGMGTLVWMVD